MVTKNTDPRPLSGIRGASIFLAASYLSLIVSGGCSGATGEDTVQGEQLMHSSSSAEEISEAVLEALASGDFERLQQLSVTENEFRSLVWPELPSSRPERGLPFEYVWGDLHQKSNNELRRLFARENGKQYELLTVDFEGDSTVYDTFTVHRESKLKVRGPENVESEERFFGSILERDGQYKLFSYIVD